MATANEVLNVARSWIGYSEANGKHREIIDYYNQNTSGYNLSYTDPWCDGFVSAVGIKAGAENIIGHEVGCERHIEHFKKLGIWIEDGTITPIPGDIILFNWDDGVQPNDGFSDHIGFVEAVNGNTITCIEGNISDAVGRRNIAVGHGNIRGYARPRYGGASSNAVVSKPVASKPVTTVIGEIKVDGKWGPETTKKAQQVFKTEIDGKVSHQDKKYSTNNGLLSSTFEWEDNPKGHSPLIKAIQNRVGVTKDGHIGPVTIRAMQKWLGVRITGTVDKPSDVVFAFQRWLNNQ